MRVLLYINSLGMGGAERVLLRLAAHWQRAGHTVLVVTQTPVSEDQLTPPAGVERLSTHSAGISGHWLSAVAQNIRRVSRLRGLLRRWQPDCVVSFLPTANVVALLAAGPLRIPVIVGERMFPAFLGLGRLQGMARDRVYSRAARVIVQTDKAAAWYRAKLGLVNLTVIPNGIALPLEKVPPHVDPSTVLPAEARVVLYVGRLAEPKLPEDAVLAFADTFADEPKWHLVIIGDGDKRSHLEHTIHQQGLADRIHCISRCGDLAPWYRRAGMFVSVSRVEGFPNVLLEAMALGCVPLAYDCPSGPAELIQQGENGFLVPVGDRTSLSRRMQQLAADDTLRARLSVRAQAVSTTFSEAAMLARWDAVLAQSADSLQR